MKITTLDGKTPDIAEENIQKLRQIFPDVFTEDKVDFEKLKQVLGNYVEDSNERYNFTWNGKGRALRLSQTPSLGTLRPCKEESKDWDTTQNLYIEGDNLEVLKLLQKSYHSKVKMIYIDPPYNTGGDFIYPDDFHDSLENYKKITGQVDSNGNKISTNTEASGRYHTDWLNMMYPRLRLARNLLTDDGIIFISIDDNEQAQLKLLCDEIFGENNFVNKLTIKTGEVYGAKAAHIKKTLVKVKDYVLVYQMYEGRFIEKQPLYDILDVFYDTHYTHILSNGMKITSILDFMENDDFCSSKFRKYNLNINMKNINTLLNLSTKFKEYFIENISPILYKDSQYNMKISQDTINKLKPREAFNHNGVLLMKTSGNTIRHLQGFKDVLRWSDNSTPAYGRTIPRGDVWDDFVKDMGNVGKEGGVNFTNGKKPVRLIRQLIQWSNFKEGIILDFFSGSSTTAHAVMQLNAEDGGNRKFIMVQLPEPTDEKDEAYKAGYMNICEIGKERIRRAGEKIKEEKGLEAQNLDIGFKVLKLDTSNIRKWQPDYNNLEQSILDYVDNYVEGRTELDVVYEIMLKYGLDLTYPVDEFTIANKKVYSIGFGMLMICLDDEITTEVAKGILEKVKELAPESSRVVFKDNGFKTDSNKTNIKEILKCGGIEEFITL